MARKISLIVGALILLVAVLGGIKGWQISTLIAQGKSFAPPPESVTAGMVSSAEWQPMLQAVGSVTAVQGVTVSAEESGIVRKITFESGAVVRRGALLVQLDTTTEQAELNAAEAQADLKNLNLRRTSELRSAGVNTPSDLDTAQAEARQAEAQVNSIRAAIAKKTVRAPFTGRLGIRQVNLGQFLNNGAPIVSLQSFDPMYVDFSLPQQRLSNLQVGQSVHITSDSFPGEDFVGTLTTINPEIDPSTRNVRLQATLGNENGRLRPGMFVDVKVLLSERRNVLAIPATAVIYAPYGDSVFVITRDKTAGRGQPGLVVRQQFVRLGEARGDMVSVLSGLQAGQQIVTSGAFKLRPGAAVAIRSTPVPDAKLAPRPTDS